MEIKSINMYKRRRFFPIKNTLRALLVFVIFLIFLIFFFNIFYINNLLQNTLIHFSAESGFKIEKIIISGRNRANLTEISKITGVKKGDPIFSVSIKDMKKNIELNPWVKNARIERSLPSTIFIKIKERVPMAIWQDRGLIGYDGEIIECDKREYPKKIIKIVGMEAPIYFPALLRLLKKFHNKISDVKAAIFLRSRRWDLILFDRTVIKLSENDQEGSIKMLIDNLSYLKDEFGENKIKSIDLRFKGSIILEMKK